MASPAQYDFIGDGSTRIFPIASRIISQDYLKLEVNNVEILDTTSYDIINNSIVFVEAPADLVPITVRVAESIEAIGELDNLTATQIVSDNILDVITVSESIDDVNTVATDILAVRNVSEDIDSVVTVSDNIDSVVTVAGGINDGSIDKAEQLITGALEGKVVKTIGVGGDFTTIIEARDWYEGAYSLMSGEVEFQLIDTVYSETIPNEGGYLFKVQNGNKVRFVSAGLDTASITILKTVGHRSHISGFNCYGGSVMELSDLLIIDGDLIDSETPIKYEEGSIGQVHDVVVEGFFTALSINTNSSVGTRNFVANSQVVGNGTPIVLVNERSSLFIDTNMTIGLDKTTKPAVGLHVTKSSKVHGHSITLTIDNCDDGIHIEDYSRINLKASALNLSNTSNGVNIIEYDNGVLEMINTVVTPLAVGFLYPFPINEKQITGSYISDGTIAVGGSSVEVIDNPVFKTLGATGDFQTLEEFSIWLDGTEFVGAGNVYLYVQPGTYYFPAFDGSYGYYYYYEPRTQGFLELRNKNVIIEGAPGVIFTTDDSIGYPYHYYGDITMPLFNLRNSTLELINITIDAEQYYHYGPAYGYIYNVDFTHLNESSHLTIDSCTINGYDFVYCNASSSIVMLDTSWDASKHASTFYSNKNSQIVLDTCTFTGSFTFGTTDASRIIVDGTTLNTNPILEDAGISLEGILPNVVGTDGSYITDTSRALLSDSLISTTVARPTTHLFTGMSIFDTTLGHPIWYNGTNWVNSAGTIV